jgi:hypothetical protein
MLFSGSASLLVIIAYFYYFIHQMEILIIAGIWIFLFDVYLDKERDAVRHETYRQLGIPVEEK